MNKNPNGRSRLSRLLFSGSGWVVPSVCTLVAIALAAGVSLAEQESPSIRLVGLVADHDKGAGSRFSAADSRTVEDKPLADFLIGTKWLMYEIPGRIVEFGEAGKFDLDDWKMQGIEARWKVTGPRQVTVTVISQKARNQTATLNFDERLSYFTGTDLDHKRQVTKSPRINSVPHDPADPYRR